MLSNEAILGTETLTAMEKRLSASATVVGVDGDYFSAATGAPSGILVRGGALDSAPLSARSALGIAADGTLSAARLSCKGTWQGSGQRRSLDLNAAPEKGHATLYTPAYGPTTPDEGGVVEVVFASFPPARAGQALTGTVGQVDDRRADADPARRRRARRPRAAGAEPWRPRRRSARPSRCG